MADQQIHTDTATDTPLLQTKLFSPRWREGMVSRPRLVKQMLMGCKGKLTLVSAPAGSGKTTLLAEWLKEVSQDSVGWVSLEPKDNDPTIFWSYCIAAIQKLHDGVGGHAMSMLYSPQPPSIESVLINLINEISTLDEDVILVLDDYHVIEAEPIHAGLSFLLDHLPAHMHLVLASRTDPSIQLSRLRVRGELTEIQATDLSFTSEEIAEFLGQSMGLRLSVEDIDRLRARTEGWVAGLQLAALSIKGRDDVGGFIEAFSGDDRYVADYLMDEVLRRQADHIRDFLLKTSILDRLSGPLCDAITGRSDGKTLLASLERDNMFVVTLDDKRQWYRYHHLFGDMLRSHFSATHEVSVSEVHLKASKWFETQNYQQDAVRHALLAEDFELAAQLIERTASNMFVSGQMYTMYKNLSQLPQPLIMKRPVLCMWSAWGAIERNDMDRVEQFVARAEEWLAASDQSAMIVEDTAAFDALPGTLNIAHAMLAQVDGNIDEALQFLHRALDILPERELLWRGAAKAILGLASWSAGDLTVAFDCFSEGLAAIGEVGEVHFQVTGTHVLADIKIAEGKLNDAADLYHHSFSIVKEWDGPTINGSGDLYLGLSDIAFMQGALDEAKEWIEKGEALGVHAALSENQYRWRLLKARFSTSERDYTGALALIEEAEQMFVPDAVPLVKTFDAIRARIWISQGDLDKAVEWQLARQMSVDDELFYLEEHAYVTLARLLIAQFNVSEDKETLQQAKRLLKRLFEAAEAGSRIGSMAEIRMLQALLHKAEKDSDAALAMLEHALVLAEPERYIRVFLEEGEPMAKLLQKVPAGTPGFVFARVLLKHFETTASQRASIEQGGLLDPLTSREMDVLQLISAGLRNQEIADQLFISLATVKRHIANVYGKLEVSHRTEAIVKARELGLVGD